MIRRRRKPFDDIIPYRRENSLEGSMWDVARHEIRPLANVRETDDKIVVSLDLPYVKKENIQLNVTEDRIEVSATMDRYVKYDHWGTIQRGCEFRSYRTTMSLPSKVVPEGATARFKSGVLEVEMPKKTQRHRITIE